MNITVVVCTYNRSDSLKVALGSLVALTLPKLVEFEILVVDNNSSDHTREVVESFCSGYPAKVRYLFEREQGLSHARNAGVRNARGEIIAFTDDDVTVDSMWLHNLTASLGPGWAGSGGRVVPKELFSSPPWLRTNERYALAPLALFDLGPEAARLDEPAFGANMAFRTEMFKRYGSFRTDLGRRANSMMSNEDTEFGYRLLAAGERLRYEPSAVVYHPIGGNRLQRAYFLSWWFGKGRADIRQLGTRPGSKYTWSGIPLYLFRDLAIRTFAWMLAIKADLRFSCKLKVWRIAGEILECYSNQREKARDRSLTLRTSSTLPKHSGQ